MADIVQWKDCGNPALAIWKAYPACLASELGEEEVWFGPAIDYWQMHTDANSIAAVLKMILRKLHDFKLSTPLWLP